MPSSSIGEQRRIYANMMVGESKVRHRCCLPHMTPETRGVLRARTSGRDGLCRCVTVLADFHVSGFGWSRTAVRIVAGGAFECAACLKTVTRHQSYRREADGHGIVFLRRGRVTLRLRHPVTLGTDADACDRRKAAELNDIAEARCFHVGFGRTMTALALDAGLHRGQVRPWFDSGGVAVETAIDRIRTLWLTERGYRR